MVENLYQAADVSIEAFIGSCSQTQGGRVKSVPTHLPHHLSTLSFSFSVSLCLYVFWVSPSFFVSGSLFLCLCLPLSPSLFIMILLTYLFIGCTGSSWLAWAFSSCGKWGLLSSCSAQASRCSGSWCRAWVLKHKLSSCDAWA